MTTSPGERLRQRIHEEDWVKGAVNYDEDLHFSTFYLRASCNLRTARLYPGYTCLIAFYDDFNEHYYLLKKECRDTAVALVNKALRRPTWLARIVQEIRRRSDRLANVFHTRTSPQRLAKLSDSKLLCLYQRHATGQRSLYRFARLPEALDRGVSYFSTYLMDYLRNRGLNLAEAEETFAILSQPIVPSVLVQELLEFGEMVECARTASEPAFRPANASARKRMFLRPELVRRLRDHQEKWQFLPYHGYGRRELATLGQYVERLAEHLHDPAAMSGTDWGKRYEEAQRARHEVLRKLDMDDAHCALFEVYPEIGASKLYRRYAQLRNFYYFDMLIAEIADRIGVNEWTIRCMLPEEVMASLQVRRLVHSAVGQRLDGCAYAILGDEEWIATGTEAKELRGLLKSKIHGPPDGAVLKGVVACRGKVVGPCKVVIRADDRREHFEKGTIVVSESTDPDLVDVLKLAGGVLTEQGGVTSHAAIICRELGIPTIIGIEGLLERVHDGDVVEVDADRGIITPLKKNARMPENGTVSGPEAIGTKAYNLGLIRSLGFAVPEFVALTAERAGQLVTQPRGEDEERFLESILQQILLSPDDKLAVRSSAVNEDSANGSLAGAYRSLLNVDPNALPAALREFFRSNRQRNGKGGYRGSVIVQRMIAADCAGVCLTLDPRTGNGNALIIEVVAGGNEALTSGAVVPDRLVVDRLTGDILEEQRRCVKLQHMDLNLGALVQQFLTLEARFGKPLDIEWAIVDHQLFILQARPIVRRP